MKTMSEAWEEGRSVGRREEAAESRGFQTHFTNPYPEAGTPKDLLAEAWERGARDGLEREYAYGAEEKAKFANPFRAAIENALSQ